MGSAATSRWRSFASFRAARAGRGARCAGRAELVEFVERLARYQRVLSASRRRVAGLERAISQQAIAHEGMITARKPACAPPR